MNIYDHLPTVNGRKQLIEAMSEERLAKALSLEQLYTDARTPIGLSLITSFAHSRML